MHQKAEATNQIQAYPTREQAPPVYPTEVLERDDAYTIATPLLAPGEVRSVAVILAAETADNQVDQLSLIDVRQAPQDRHGKIIGVYGEARVHPATQFLLSDTRHVNYAAHTGYASIYAGDRAFIYGKEGDETRRFPSMSPTTSRSHFSVLVTKGGVQVTDLGSTTHTRITETTPVNPRQAEQAQRVEHAVGFAATQSPDKPKLNIGVEGAARELPLREVTRYLRAAHNQVGEHGTFANDVMETAEYKLAPVAAVRLGDKEYAFSRIIDGPHKQAVGYTRLESGELVPRMFYKSQSDGGWRVTPYVETFNGNRLNKGGDGKDGGYVQLTKPVEAITQLLEQLDTSEAGHVQIDTQQRQVLKQLFSISRQAQEMLAFFEAEVQRVRLSDTEQRGLYDVYQPGKGYLKPAQIARKELAELQVPEKFEPEFTPEGKRSYTYDHSLAGETKVRVYDAEYRGEPIEWHVAEAANGTVWPEKIVYSDAEVGTYGTPDRVILAGALSGKSHEYAYANQLAGMEPGLDFEPVAGNNTYVSLRPYWDRMAWVQRFRNRDKIAEQGDAS